jgi:hypothetical protein
VTPIDRYDLARQMHHTALTELVEAAAGLGRDPSDAVEMTELLRAELHRTADTAVDDAQLNRPSATRPVLRTRRHREPSL